MNKKKIIALGSAILAIIAAVGVAIWTNKNDTVISGEDSEAINEVVENNEADEDLPLVSNDGVNLTLTEDNFDEIKVHMSTFEDAVIIKELDDLTLDKNGSIINSICLEKADFHMLNSTDEYFTFDTLAFYNDPELKEDGSNWDEMAEKHKVDTEKHFDKSVFDCKNLFDLSLAVVDTYGINTSYFLNSRLDKNNYDRIYKEVKQKHYYCDIEKDFNLSYVQLSNDDYDEIISKKLCITTDIDGTGNEYFSFITIKIEYLKNEELHNRNLIFMTRIL